MTKQEFINKLNRLHIPYVNKKIRLGKCLGFGSFGSVYSISPRRIVKIMGWKRHFSQQSLYELALDEIRGSRKSKYDLPILRVHLRKYKGRLYPMLIKRKLKRLEYHKWYGLHRKTKNMWDSKPSNFGCDSKGNIYRFDTATRECIDIYYRDIG